jgi:hypothetical protein
MLKKMKLVTLMFAFALSTAFIVSPGFAYNTGPETSCSAEKQSPTFFMNENIKGYTAQVDVIPGQDKMIVRFFDERGYEARLDDVRLISAQVILADGTKEDVIFLPERSIHNKKRFRRAASVFIARGQWIGHAEGFALKMNVPVQGDTFEMAYSYGCNPSEGNQLSMLTAQ